MPVHDPLVLERWRAIFATWRSSGLSVAAFCRSRSLNTSSRSGSAWHLGVSDREVDEADQVLQHRPRRSIAYEPACDVREAIRA